MTQIAFIGTFATLYGVFKSHFLPKVATDGMLGQGVIVKTLKGLSHG